MSEITIEKIKEVTSGVYDRYEWRKHDFEQVNHLTGEVLHSAKGVEFPASWSANAETIVVTKYFRGDETSLKHLIDRIVIKYTTEGFKHGYFDSEKRALEFAEDLANLIVSQKFAFNSPVWFNVGVPGVPQTPSACFLLSVHDSLESILNWYREEGLIFKGGSGAGVNLSNIRSSYETLSGTNNTASGPVSFMRGADASAGTIKSGGRCIAPWSEVYTTERGPVRVDELAESGEDFTTISYNPMLGRTQAVRARAWKSGEKELFKLTTDKGVFTLSGDHPVLLMTGEYRHVSKLTPGNSIRPMCVSEDGHGYLRIGLHDGNKGKIQIHRLVAQDILGVDISGKHVHHMDMSPMNNAPENLEVVDARVHVSGHSIKKMDDGTHPFLKFHGEGNHPKIAGDRNGMSHASGNRTEEYRRNRDAGMQREDVYRKGQRAAVRQRMLNKAYEVANNGGDIDTFDGYLRGRMQLKGWKTFPARAVQLRKIEERFGSYEAFRDEARANNHCVVSVEPVGRSVVYDVEVDSDTPYDKSVNDGHNFFLVSETQDTEKSVSGIIVSNSRRAAKLVCLDVSHPDIEEFIGLKAREERKIRALSAAGFDMSLNGKDMTSVQYQNANNSVQIDDEFMRAVVGDGEYALRAVTTGETVKTVRARDLFRQIAQAAWECADPGVQFSDTINAWHTLPEAGRIETSNPCFTGDTLVWTVNGPNRIDELAKLGHRWVYTYDRKKGRYRTAEMVDIRLTREKADIVEVTFDNGGSIRCTPDHKFLMHDGEYVEAWKLQQGNMFMRGSADFAQRSVVSVEPAGKADVYDGAVPNFHNFMVATSDRFSDSVFAHNCGEYLSISDSSCNLGSFNLVKFMDGEGCFELDAFLNAVDVAVWAMDISVTFGDFPTEKISENTKKYRQLGLGVANLGAMLMRMGMPYDSDEGRLIAAEIMSAMTAQAYIASARLAEQVGPYFEYEDVHKEAHTRVLEKHREAHSLLWNHCYASGMDCTNMDDVATMWEHAADAAEDYGLRNAQVTLAAPTGTISFMMDCDTTGVEPDFALVKYKTLVGGSSMSIINESVPHALRRLGYENVDELVEYVTEHGTVVGAPGIKEHDLAVFDCAIGERAISAEGHLKMMEALQPFLSGAISKTVNLPESVTVEEVEQIYLDAWQQGLKSVTVYRDNCKVGQPLESKKPKEEKPKPQQEVAPKRRRLPKQRQALTTSFRVGGAEGYLTTGSHEDGQLGEMFLKLGKQGSTMAGLMDAFSVAVSIALQYGVPLETYMSKFTGTVFEPSGMTDDPDVRMATSIIDYVFRRLAIDHMDFDTRAAYGVLTAAERRSYVETGSYTSDEEKPASVEPRTVSKPVESLPLCATCGSQMRPAGTCYACEGCGATSGCS